MANSRRGFLAAAVPAGGVALAGSQRRGDVGTDPARARPEPPAAIILRHDQRVELMLRRQITDEASPNAGGYPDEWEIVSPQSGAGAVSTFAAAFLCPQSRFYRDPELMRRILLGSRFLSKKQLSSGNIDLLTTNFDSPPDTGFVVHGVAPAAILARRAGEDDLANALLAFLRKAGQAMAAGGVHTPNHRWVVCAALALLHHLEPNPVYTKRIGEWLAEGIDIDEDGLYTERSPLVYSPVVNRSLIFLAEFLSRPDLLDPVRRNLHAALHLMHANGELETGLSGRQDQNTVGSMGVNWLALQYLGELDRNGVFAGLARKAEADHGDLPLWLLLPVLQRREAQIAPPPEEYRVEFRNASLHRIRRGRMSVSIFTRGYDRLFSIRNGDAVVEAVRFASAFFGKGQFVPTSFTVGENAIDLVQTLTGPYYQPLDPPERIPADPGAWSGSRQRRKQSEICTLTQRCRILDGGTRFELEFLAEGTPNVPVAVEISLRMGAAIERVRTAPASADAYLTIGDAVLVRSGSDSLQIDAPASGHAYTQLRGALPKLPGPGIYVTGFTPFRERIVFRAV